MSCPITARLTLISPGPITRRVEGSCIMPPEVGHRFEIFGDEAHDNLFISTSRVTHFNELTGEFLTRSGTIFKWEKL
jgi:hypothetical protein